MDQFSWIMSEGGALICVESDLATSWGGVFRLSVTKQGSKTDYDRACEGLPKVLTTVPLAQGAALLFHEPFDTSFWRRPTDGKVFVIQIEACDIDTGIDMIMDSLDEGIFQNPIDVTFFEFSRGGLTMFDAAEDGRALNKKTLEIEIEPGRYMIKSCFLETEKHTMLLHRLDIQNK